MPPEIAEQISKIRKTGFTLALGNLAEDKMSILQPEYIIALFPRLAALKRSQIKPDIAIADNIGYMRSCIL